VAKALGLTLAQASDRSWRYTKEQLDAIVDAHTKAKASTSEEVPLSQMIHEMSSWGNDMPRLETHIGDQIIAESEADIVARAKGFGKPASPEIQLSLEMPQTLVPEQAGVTKPTPAPVRVYISFMGFTRELELTADQLLEFTWLTAKYPSPDNGEY
jgi:hypothetical protein